MIVFAGPAAGGGAIAGGAIGGGAIGGGAIGCGAAGGGPAAGGRAAGGGALTGWPCLLSTGAAYPNIVFAAPPDGAAGAAGIGRPHVPHAGAVASTAAPQYGHGLVGVAILGVSPVERADGIAVKPLGSTRRP
jgi:hypothetical protein